MTTSQEQAYFKQTLDDLQQSLGSRPKTWTRPQCTIWDHLGPPGTTWDPWELSLVEAVRLTPGFSVTERTPEIAAESG